MDPIYEPYWSNYLEQFDLSASRFQQIVSNTTKYCVIVEPREHPLLILVIKNFMYLLQDKGWGHIIFHGTKNEEFIKRALSGWPNVIYENLHTENLTLKQYNDLYKSVSFWKILLKYNCINALTFETDAILLKPDVDLFLQYDYIGAPWKDTPMGLLVGNSGLCLRKPAVMIDIITKYKKTDLYINNDIYFSYMLKKYKYNIPTVEEANTFSVETIFYPDPCGFHKPLLSSFPQNEYQRILSKRYI
jgi:hypothetical protein